MKPLKRFTLTAISLFFIATHTLYSQYDLIRSYEGASSVEEKCKAFDDLANYYMRNNLDSVRVISMDMLLYADQEKNDYAFNMARKNLGSYFIRTGNEIKGIIELKKSKSFYSKKENFDLVTEILNEIGNGYQYQGKNDIALTYYYKSLEVGEQANDEFIQKISLINIAQAYLNLNKLDSALINAQLYRDWTLKLNRIESTANAYAVIGKIQEAKEDLGEAIVNYKQSEVFARKIDSKIQQSHAYTNLAIALFMQGETDQSLEYFEHALELRKKVNNTVLLCDAYLNMGEIHSELNNRDLAFLYYNKGYQLAIKTNKLANQIEFIDALIGFYGDEVATAEIDKLKEQKSKLENELRKKKTSDFELDEIVLNELNDMKTAGYSSGSKELSWGFYFGALVIFLLAVVLGLRRRLI